MNNNKWMSVEDGVPSLDDTIEIRYEVEFVGKYTPGNEKGDWLAFDGSPLRYKPVSWRHTKE